MSNFIRQANTFWPVAEQALDVQATLPVGTYTVKHHPEKGFYFERIEDFKMPSKIYGDLQDLTDRIITTFLDRPGATGVLLAGQMGSGKTLLAKNIAIEIAKRHGMPTIVIGTAYAGEAFNTLIQGIRQPAMIFFDEFEKIYRETSDDRRPQEGLLTLLDGTYASQKLFVLTTNDLWAVDRHMRNRPGRLFYALNYVGLDKTFIQEYCEDNLKDKSQIDGVQKVASLFEHFSFDLLKALVEEMNRYGESAKASVKYLNAVPEIRGHDYYNVQLYVNGNEIPKASIQNKQYYFDPTEMTDIEIKYVSGGNIPNVDEDELEELMSMLSKEDFKKIKKPTLHSALFTPKDLVKVDPARGQFTFQNRKAQMLVLSQKMTYSWDFMSEL